MKPFWNSSPPLSLGSWRKRGSEPSCGRICRICRRGDCRVWPRPAETRRTCRRERTLPRASQRPALPTPPRSHTQTHRHTQTRIQYHSTVKHNDYLTWEPINASIAVWKHSHMHTPCRHDRHKHMYDRLSICRYLKNTEAHITHNEWDLKEKKMSTSHTRPTISYASHTCLSASFLSIPTRETSVHEVTHMRALEIKHVRRTSPSFQNWLCFSRAKPSPPSINQQTLHTVKLWRGMNNDDPKDENSLKVQILMFLLLQLILWVLLLC